MGKLSLLSELEIMINTGEITTAESKEEALASIKEIKKMVELQITQEIWNDVTDYDMGYYAPEHPDWRHYLYWLNGTEDYERVLAAQYTNTELEALWQNSHIGESLNEKEIKEDLTLQIGQLKMIFLLNRMGGKPCRSEKMESMIRGIKARITGLYNILYEG